MVTVTIKENLRLSDGSAGKDETRILKENILLSDSQFVPTGGGNVIFVFDPVTSNWIQVNGIKYFKIVKRLNQMSQFIIDFSPLSPTKRIYIKEFAKVMLFSGSFLILKGRIQKVNYATAFTAHLEGFGMEATILDKEYSNAVRSPDDPDRVQYDNVSAQTIARELLSTNADGLAPWTMTPRSYGLFVADYGLISMRYEYANKLTALGNLANAINYDWWVDHSPMTYADDYFNIAPIKGNQTAPDAHRTFVIGTQCQGTDYQKDITNIANYVKIQGYGDGINQLFTSTYNASPIWTTLSANISAAAVVIPLIDSSAFAAAGTVRIADEIITYTGNAGNSLTGCTRGTGGTTAKPHRSGCYIEKYVPYTSPEANSSIFTNGLMELTLTYRDIRDESTLELVASNELIDRMSPIERITIKPNNPSYIVKTLQTGDLIHIKDSGSSLDSDFRVVGIIYENNYGRLSVSLEASNKSLTFIEQMQKEREKNQSLQKYMQGSTNVYVVNNSENCDTGYGCEIRTYIPAETIAINHVKISYTVSAYRSYSQATATGSAHSHSISGMATGQPGINHTHHISGIVNGYTGRSYGAHSHAFDINSPTHSHTHGGHTNSVTGTGSTLAHTHTYNMFSSYSTYTGANLSTATMYTQVQDPSYHSHTLNATFTTDSDSDTPGHTHNIVGTATSAESSHTHQINYGIAVGINTITIMQIFIDGIDRTAAIQAQIGHTLAIVGNEADIDISAWITDVGQWHTINIQPTGTCRIAGELWNQIFIESK